MQIPNFIGLILGLAQVIVYLIYKKKPVSAKGPAVTLGLGKAEMVKVMAKEAFHYEEAQLKDGAVKAVEKALKRVKSLPEPMMNHQHTIRKVLKTLSFGTDRTNQPHEDDADLEIGVDAEKYHIPILPIKL